MADLSRLSINQVTTREQWTLREAIEGYSRHGVHQIAIWRDKLAACGLPTAKQLLADHGMKVTGLNRIGPLIGEGISPMAAVDDGRRAIDEAAELKAACLLILPGGMLPGSKDLSAARSKVHDLLEALLPYARHAEVTLAIEPLHPVYAAERSCINTVQQGHEICMALGEGAGLVIDVYHVWWDPNLRDQIAKANGGEIIGFHVSDWLVPTKDPLLDRGMMGDGVIDIPAIRRWVEAAGYSAAIEVEIFSAGNWWKRDPEEVVKTCIERYHTSV